MLMLLKVRMMVLNGVQLSKIHSPMLAKLLLLKLVGDSLEEPSAHTKSVLKMENHLSVSILLKLTTKTSTSNILNGSLLPLLVPIKSFQLLMILPTSLEHTVVLI